MAKDKEEPAAGDYEFKLPDFDEDQFIHREMVSFKTTSILFGWGIVAAAASWAAFSWRNGDPNTGWLLGLLLCGAFGFSLKWLFPKLGADVAHFKRREWTGTGFLFFFTWLAFFMVAVNPPVSDFAAPQVIISADPPIQVPNGTVSLSMLVVDNNRVADQSIKVTRDTRDGQVVDSPMTGSSGDVRWYNLTTLAAGKYVVAGTGVDAHGRTTVAFANFTVAVQDIRLDLPRDAILDTTSLIVAHIGTYPGCHVAHDWSIPCLRKVTLKMTSGGVEIPMDADTERIGDWKANANSKGWTRGVNAFTVEAEFLNHYAGSHSIPGGRITLPGTYSVNLTVDPGEHVANVAAPLAGRSLNVPHLELVALASVLIVGAAVMRRRGSK